MAVALESIFVTDSTQRANALEVIESVGHPKLVGRLLPLWEASRPQGGPIPYQSNVLLGIKTIGSGLALNS